MLENIIKSGLHWKIKIIQFGSHFFSEIPRLTERFCVIRSELKKSHRMVYGLAFGWERWDRKEVSWRWIYFAFPNTGIFKTLFLRQNWNKHMVSCAHMSALSCLYFDLTCQSSNYPNWLATPGQNKQFPTNEMNRLAGIYFIFFVTASKIYFIYFDLREKVNLWYLLLTLWLRLFCCCLFLGLFWFNFSE